MRLKKIQAHFEAIRQPYQYWEEDDCGSITFLHRGLSYHIWEYPAPERGADSNVRSAGRSEDFGEKHRFLSDNFGSFRTKPIHCGICRILKNFKYMNCG